MDDEGPRALEPQEREDIEADLGDLSAMRECFAPQGVKGVVIACPDCGTPLYAQSSRAPDLLMLPVGLFGPGADWFVPNQLIFARSQPAPTLR